MRRDTPMATSMAGSPHLAVVIPAYNEEAALRQGKLHRVAEWLSNQPWRGELVVVDDGSEDGTVELAGSVAQQLIQAPHRGKASAILTGIAVCRAELILFTDMDQATPISEAGKLVAALEGGAQVAIGNRGLVRQGAPPGRYLLSWGQVALRNLLLGLRLADTQCGFKGFRQAAVRRIIENLYLYHPRRIGAIRGPSVSSGFDTELLYVARRLGYSIAEVPVTWTYQETRRVRPLRDAWQGVVDLWRIAAAARGGHYP